jgi:hypothetical protein
MKSKAGAVEVGWKPRPKIFPPDFPLADIQEKINTAMLLSPEIDPHHPQKKGKKVQSPMGNPM